MEKVKVSITVLVHDFDHLLYFGVRGVLTQWPHDITELLWRNRPIPILIKQRESFLKIWEKEKTIILSVLKNARVQVANWNAK